MPSAHSVDPLSLYAAAIDTSDYAVAVVPAIRTMTPAFRSLLDIGAGGGQLGNALRGADAQWTAIEPSPPMCERLARFRPPPVILRNGWSEAAIPPASHDMVLAATMPALFEHPEQFLDRCQQWARRAVIWVVPAQNGPKGLILAGCLPQAWHGEDETPGIEITLGRLPWGRRPQRSTLVSWTFTAILPEITPIAAYLADRLGWPLHDPRRADLQAHLERQAKPDQAGYRLEIPRKSAIIMWGS